MISDHAPDLGWRPEENGAQGLKPNGSGLGRGPEGPLFHVCASVPSRQGPLFRLRA